MILTKYYGFEHIFFFVNPQETYLRSLEILDALANQFEISEIPFYAAWTGTINVCKSGQRLYSNPHFPFRRGYRKTKKNTDTHTHTPFP